MQKGKQLQIWLISFFLTLPLWQIKAATVVENVSWDTLKIERTDGTAFTVFPSKKKEGPHKITAIFLALLTGPLGGHRVYLGTSTQVPLIYTATLGGFGILVVADIIVILVSKDLSELQNNDKIFMWISSKQN